MGEGVREPQKKQNGPLRAVFNVLGVVLCVLFIPIIILNVVMIVRSYTDPDHIPSVFGFSPVVVLSGSMSGDNPDSFDAGDMIFIQKTDPYTLKVNDVICYLEEESAVTHRIIEVQEENGLLMYITQGDANNAEDAKPVYPNQVQGKYTGVSIAGAGNFAMFLQSMPGMLIFIGGPILLFVLWDVLRRVAAGKQERREKQMIQAESTSKQQEMEAMEKELERLRAQVNAREASPEDQDSSL